MINLILFVLNDLSKLEEVLNGWEEAGAPGVTIIHSSGLGRIRQGIFRDDLPLLPSLDDLLEHEETRNYTLFSAIDDEAIVERVITTTLEIVGDLNKPHTGILLVVPVVRGYGVRKNWS